MKEGDVLTKDDQDNLGGIDVDRMLTEGWLYRCLPVVTLPQMPDDDPQRCLS